MGHGKESPRQKMIGMMYLVLTALLALNVSKDAVEAFKLVDKSLTKTTENFTVKNDMIYQEFDQAASENPQKAGPWKNIAYEVKKRANEMFDYIQELKIEILIKAEGEDSEVFTEDGGIDVEHVKKIDENNIPSEILVGSDQNGKAFDMKAAMEEYRTFLLDVIGNKDIAATNSIQASLDTEDPVIKGEKVLWVNHMFQASPLIAAITLLSKLQSDIRNTEAETLNFLYRQIDAGSFKFNSLIPTIITNSNYIMRGNEYTAEVFIAATDTTQQPEVLVGKYETIVGANGIEEYRMTGSDYLTLTVDERGRGIYKIKPTVFGEKTWGGLIRMRAPDGNIISYPFEEKYTVAPPNVVVSPTAMNVFYVGLDNPVDISVSGAENVTATMTNGTIKKGTTKDFRGSFIANPRTPGTMSNVTVTAEVNGVRRSFPPIEFRVQIVPPPVAKVAGKNSGAIAKAMLAAQVMVFAELEDFLFNIKYDVTAFTIEINDRGFSVTEPSTSSRITAAQKSLINRLKRNDRVVFTDVKAVGPDGRQRSLPPIVLRIE
ncbi:hypothetical protein ES708_04788 [subsurface metagenome]